MKIIDGKRYPTISELGIYGFFGEYRWLSNFHLCEVSIQGLKYPSSEHAYQAMKSIPLTPRKKIRDAPTCKEAKWLGQEVKIRPDWESVKAQKMYEVLRCKFVQNTYLRILLDKTGSKYLEETNDWGDRFYGVCDGVGSNKLGILLMRIRTELRK